MSEWPKLSEQLTDTIAPNACQRCGDIEPECGPYFQRWREHDDDDRMTSTIIVLCKCCADTVIEDHPRLYSPVERFAPLTGFMSLCIDCRYREGTACTHPSLKANGGEGLMITGPKPTRMHVLRCGKGARSGWMEIYPGEPRDCAGREVIPSDAQEGTEA